jgi:4-amino-4-deoxy-L-arabinose transferase-like glycosyltransferase
LLIGSQGSIQTKAVIFTEEAISIPSGVPTEGLATRFFRTGSPLQGALFVLLLWAALYLPNTALRPLYQEEGRRALLAIDVYENGNWFTPAVAGERYRNKPPLLPWMIAAAAAFTGGVNELAVRLPSLLFTLLGALLVFVFVRPHVRFSAALFSSAVFLLSPLVIEKARMGETDMIVTVMCMAALTLWWRGLSAGRLHWHTWAAAGCCLTVAAMAKGPPPLSFFAVTVGATAWAKKRYRDFPGILFSLFLPLAAVSLWAATGYDTGDLSLYAREMRLVADPGSPGAYALRRLSAGVEILLALMPWLAVGFAVFVPKWRQRLEARKDLAEILTVYSLLIPAILLFWVGSRPRYVMPAVPTVAVASGLVWDALGRRRNRRMSQWLLAIVCTAAAGVFAYHAIAVPLLQERYNRERHIAVAIGEALKEVPGPVVAVHLSHNLVYYSGLAARSVTLKQVRGIPPPYTMAAHCGIYARLPAYCDCRWEIFKTIEAGENERYCLARITAADDGESPGSE